MSESSVDIKNELAWAQKQAQAAAEKLRNHEDVGEGLRTDAIAKLKKASDLLTAYRVLVDNDVIKVTDRYEVFRYQVGDVSNHYVNQERRIVSEVHSDGQYMSQRSLPWEAK